MGAHLAPDVMPGGQAIGAEVARQAQEVAELDGLVAGDAGDRGLAAQISIGEFLHHLVAEPVLVVQHVMGDADFGGDVAGIVDIAPGAACILAANRGAVIVKLEGEPDHLIALVRQQRRRDRGIHPARHRHHHLGLSGGLARDQRLGRLPGRAGSIKHRRHGGVHSSIMLVASCWRFPPAGSRSGHRVPRP